MDVLNPNKNVYKPTFDPTSGSYVDCSPFEYHSKNNQTYVCLCNHKGFNTLTTFKSHIKTKSHTLFLENYKLHVEEINDAKSSSNDYQTKYELTQRVNDNLQKQVNELHNEMLHYKFLSFILKYKMKKIDQFEDCY